MTFRWSWRRASWVSENPGPQPGDEILSCECGSDLPAVKAVPLHSVVKREGAFLLLETGARMACQSCGKVWSWGPRGKFKQHAAALPPWSDPVAPTPEREVPPAKQNHAPSMPLLRQPPRA